MLRGNRHSRMARLFRLGSDKSLRACQCAQRRELAADRYLRPRRALGLCWTCPNTRNGSSRLPHRLRCRLRRSSQEYRRSRRCRLRRPRLRTRRLHHQQMAARLFSSLQSHLKPAVSIPSPRLLLRPPTDRVLRHRVLPVRLR